MYQHEIWAQRTASMNVDLLIQNATSPDEFQVDIKRIIDSYRDVYKDVIEAGCEAGITSLILDDAFDKYLLDINPGAITIARNVFEKLGKDGKFFVGDMFCMPFEDGSFDVVFNAGVIEHFGKTDRVRALAEYKRVVRESGKILIAFPNHYSIPYRFSYLLLRFLGRWQYPAEFKLHAMQQEIEEAGLLLEKRLVVASSTPYEFLPLRSFLQPLFRFMSKVVPFEGYLTILIIKKRG